MSSPSIQSEQGCINNIVCSVWHVKYILCIFICIKHASWLKESILYTQTHTHTQLTVTLLNLCKPHAYTQCAQTQSGYFNTKISRQTLWKNITKPFQSNSAAQFLFGFCFGLVRYNCIDSSILLVMGQLSWLSLSAQWHACTCNSWESCGWRHWGAWRLEEGEHVRVESVAAAAASVKYIWIQSHTMPSCRVWSGAQMYIHNEDWNIKTS